MTTAAEGTCGTCPTPDKGTHNTHPTHKTTRYGLVFLNIARALCCGCSPMDVSGIFHLGDIRQAEAAMKEKGLSINKYAEAVQKGEIMMPSPPQPPSQPPPPRPLNHMGIYSPVAAPPSGPPPPLPPMEEPIFVEEDSDEVCVCVCV